MFVGFVEQQVEARLLSVHQSLQAQKEQTPVGGKGADVRHGQRVGRRLGASKYLFQRRRGHIGQVSGFARRFRVGHAGDALHDVHPFGSHKGNTVHPQGGICPPAKPTLQGATFVSEEDRYLHIASGHQVGIGNLARREDDLPMPHAGIDFRHILVVARVVQQFDAEESSVRAGRHLDIRTEQDVSFEIDLRPVQRGTRFPRLASVRSGIVYHFAHIGRSFLCLPHANHLIACIRQLDRGRHLPTDSIPLGKPVLGD